MALRGVIFPVHLAQGPINSLYSYGTGHFSKNPQNSALLLIIVLQSGDQHCLLSLSPARTCLQGSYQEYSVCFPHYSTDPDRKEIREPGLEFNLQTGSKCNQMCRLVSWEAYGTKQHLRNLEDELLKLTTWSPLRQHALGRGKRFCSTPPRQQHNCYKSYNSAICKAQLKILHQNQSLLRIVIDELYINVQFQL